jgi:uncharacterized membrane protein
MNRVKKDRNEASVSDHSFLSFKFSDISKIKLNGGIIHVFCKTSLIALLGTTALSVVIGTVVRSSLMFFVCIGFFGILLLITFLFSFYFVLRHPEIAILSGAEMIKREEILLAAKNRQEIIPQPNPSALESETPLVSVEETDQPDSLSEEKENG